MGFEMYVRTGGRNLAGNPEPVVLLQKSGQIVLSGGATRLLGVKDGDSLVAYFNAAAGIVGIRAATASDPAGAKLKAALTNPNVSGSALKIGVSGFLKRYEIDVSKAARQYALDSDNREGLATFPLPRGSWNLPIDITPIRERLKAKRDAS